MKTLVFSDTHLTTSFDKNLYDFLRIIISGADQVIINGDFWEAHFEKFENFLNSPWRNLFPLLKSKKTVYIFGNHDKETYMDARVNVFSDIHTRCHQIQINGTAYLFEHGDRFFPNENEDPPSKMFESLAVSFEQLMVTLFGKRFYRLIGTPLNNTMKKYFRKTAKKNDFIVCGHTHFGEIDNENRFANCGAIRHGLAQYLLIDGGGMIIEKVERY